MKLKYHKIHAVDMAVCTCEQKVAYNIAFQSGLNGRDVWEKRKDKVNEIGRNEFITDEIAFFMKQWARDYCDSKLNVDAIQAALQAGLKNYYNAGCPILSTYSEIGKMFPALYL